MAIFSDGGANFKEHCPWINKFKWWLWMLSLLISRITYSWYNHEWIYGLPQFPNARLEQQSNWIPLCGSELLTPYCWLTFWPQRNHANCVSFHTKGNAFFHLLPKLQETTNCWVQETEGFSNLVFTKYCKDQEPLFIMPRENSLQSFTYRYSSTHLIAGKYEFSLVKY